MSAGGANGSKHSAHMSGKVGGGAVVYAGMGFNFVDPKGPYNASGYKGISFWAKAGPGTTHAVTVGDQAVADFPAEFTSASVACSSFWCSASFSNGI